MINSQSIIDELEKIDADLSSSNKICNMIGSLSENLWFINVFKYSNNWIKCKNYVKKLNTTGFVVKSKG